MKLFNYFALALGAGHAVADDVKMDGEQKATYDSLNFNDVFLIRNYLLKSCPYEDTLDKLDKCRETADLTTFNYDPKYIKNLLSLAGKSGGPVKPMTDEEIRADMNGNIVQMTDDLTDQRFINGDPEAKKLVLARKLKQLKVLILWLQPEHRFARYCFYGCWCLPDNDHRLFTVGYGKPVDNIDGSCKRQSQCYDCAQIDHPDRVCDPNTMGYSFKLHQDPTDPTNHWKKSIECTDNPKSSKGSCRRSICECDKKLAEDLRTYFNEWDINNHQEQGTFDSATRCIVEGCKGGNCGGRTVECCGNLGSGPRMPYKTDGRRKCCGDKTYDSTFQECCEDDSLAAIGAC